MILRTSILFFILGMIVIGVVSDMFQNTQIEQLKEELETADRNFKLLTSMINDTNNTIVKIIELNPDLRWVDEK